MSKRQQTKKSTQPKSSTVRTTKKSYFPSLARYAQLEARANYQWYMPTHIQPLYPAITLRNYTQVSRNQLSAHATYTETDYFREELKEISTLTATGVLKGVFECPADNPYVNNCVLNYIRSRPNSRLAFMFQTQSDDTDATNNYNTPIPDLVTTLAANRALDVITYKTLTLSPSAALALVYQLLASSSAPIRGGFVGLCKYAAAQLDIHIDPKLDWPLKDHGGRSVSVTVLVVETTNPSVLSGIVRGSGLPHFMVTQFPRVAELAGTVFNQNSLDFLNTQNLKRMMSFSNATNTCGRNINIFKRILYEKFTPLYRSKFLVLSGGMLYIHGLRYCSDVDFFVSNYPEHTGPRHMQMDAITERFFLDEITRPEIFDGYMPDKRWKQFWPEWHSQWAGTFGAKSMIECIHNPKYHFYYMGLKFIVLQAEINRRNIRSRPAAVADLLMMQRFLGLDFAIDPIKPEVVRSERRIKRTSQNQFCKTVQYKLWEKYKVRYTADQIAKHLVFEF